MRLAAGRLLRNAMCSLGVLAIIGGISVGLPAFNRAVPATRAVAPDRPYPLGGGVTVVPPPGAVVDLGETRHAVDRGRALFVLGRVRYELTVAPYRGDLEAAAERLRARLRERERYRITNSAGAVRGEAELVGWLGDISPGARDRTGRYALFLSGKRLVEVVVTGPPEELARWLADVEASVASIRALE